MENKETAVEWLEEQFNKGSFFNWKTVFEQAKAIEKEQMIEFANDVSIEILNENIHSIYSIEQHYNETYAKKDIS